MPSDFQEASRAYRRWLEGEQVPPVRADLKRLEARLRKHPRAFLRGTFFRWQQLWPAEEQLLLSLGHLAAGAPVVLSVGDLHVENFGTWRNEEEQLAWGVSDLGQAFPLPYTQDLVRLATSAWLAHEKGTEWGIADRDIGEAIATGYAEGLAGGGQAFVLTDTHHRWLAEIASHPSRRPKRFWRRLKDRLMGAPEAFPEAALAEATEELERQMELPRLRRAGHRQAGIEGLGRLHWVQVRGAGKHKVAREAAMRVPSACYFAARQRAKADGFAEKLLAQAVRSPDPELRFSSRWIIRRLGPDIDRVEFRLLKNIRRGRLLLEAMGFETANLHLGTGNRKAVLKHLRSQPAHWLTESARRMAALVQAEYEAWRGA